AERYRHLLGNRPTLFRSRVLVAHTSGPVPSGVPSGCGSSHHVPDLLRLRRRGDEPNPVSSLLLLALAGTSIRFQADSVLVRPRRNRLLDASAVAYVVGLADPSMAPFANRIVLAGRCPGELSTNRPCQCPVSVGVSTPQTGAGSIFPDLWLYVGPDE